MYRILLADDQAIFRAGLRRVIEAWDDFEVVGEASNGAEAVELARILLPDAVLMDLQMPVVDGVAAVRSIYEGAGERAPVCIILTVAEDADSLSNAIHAGAQGYLLKDTPIRRLHSQLQDAMRGEAPLSGKMATLVVDAMRGEGGKALGFDIGACRTVSKLLTARELEVLILIAEGLTNKEIAEKLFVSEKTIKKHLNNVYTKIDVANRAQAAVYAIRAGLV